MRDFKSRARPDLEYDADSLVGWREKVDHFLSVEVSHEKDEVAKKAGEKRKAHRLCTSDLAYAMDWQMQVSSGHSWEEFLVLESDVHPRVPLHKRFRITIGWDMGPDNLCLTGYAMNRKRLRFCIFFSLTHLIQRAMW